MGGPHRPGQVPQLEPVHHLRRRHHPGGGAPGPDDPATWTPGNGFKPCVTAVEQHHYIEWLGRLGLPGIFDGRHSFTPTPMAGGRTLVQQSETFTGMLVPFTAAVLARTRAGFVEMNEALARRITLTRRG